MTLKRTSTSAAPAMTQAAIRQLITDSVTAALRSVSVTCHACREKGYYKNDQMNCVINCLTSKSTWDGMILYHEGPSDVKESRVMDLKLCYNTLKFKEGDSLTQTFTRYKDLMNELVFQDRPDDEDDTKSSQEYINDLEEEYQAVALLAKYKRHTKDFEAKYKKVKAKLALLSSSALAPSSSSGKNKGLIAKTYDWDKEKVSSDDNEVTEYKALMALVDEEKVSVGKERCGRMWEELGVRKTKVVTRWGGGCFRAKVFYLVTKMGDEATCGDVMEPTSVPVISLPLTNRKSEELVEGEDRKQTCFLDGNNSSGTKKSRGLNSGIGNTGDGDKTIDEVIGVGIDGLTEESEDVFPSDVWKIVRGSQDIYRKKHPQYRKKCSATKDFLGWKKKSSYS
nr:retrovirus-related Pol polyprotein from transposon TNT 1-94 [Tanacetum cinerariifolium]